jgi:hypothetical protein
MGTKAAFAAMFDEEAEPVRDISGGRMEFMAYRILTEAPHRAGSLYPS